MCNRKFRGVYGRSKKKPFRRKQIFIRNLSYMLVILFLVGIGMYFYAGWVIAEITFRLYEQVEPEYFWNYHRERRSLWDLSTTKLILKLFLMLFWSVAFFSVKSEITKIIDLKNLKT